MKYIEYKVTTVPDEEAAEIVVAELAELGFESFSEYSEAERSISAYLPAAEIAREKEIEAYLREAGYPYRRNEIRDDTNWNAVWESQFEPILLEDRCCIRAPFHERRDDVEYQVVIMPKMSFGTGHHATTSLMLSRILEMNLQGAIGLDMGSGTGVLAILAVLRGAAHVEAIDIDRWAYENCVENVEMNRVTGRVEAIEGDASRLGDTPKYDFILANINRNILLADLPTYARVLKPGGTILLSGFLEVDVPIIRQKAVETGLSPKKTGLKSGWALVECVKNPED
jgi:ribosomal protein L11 methyltransferase